MIDWSSIKPVCIEQIAHCAGLDPLSVVWQRGGQPYHSSAMITLLVDNVRNPGTDETFYESFQPSVTSGTNTFAILEDMTLDVYVDTAVENIVFPGDMSDIGDIVTAINDIVPGLASDEDGYLVLTSPTEGGKIQVQGGTANDVFLFSTLMYHGAGRPRITGQRLFTLAVLASAISQEDGEFALTFLDKIRARIERDGVIQALDAVNVSFNSIQEARDRTFNDGQHEWSMYGFNIECGTISDDIDTDYDGATIESAGVVGTIESYRDGTDIPVNFTAPEPEA